MARTTMKINQNWFFTKGQIDPASPDFAGMEPVTIPHTWNALDGQDGGADYYRGLCWYARELELDAVDGQLYLEFEGVSQIACVYVNGNKVCTHENGFSTFRVNITPFVSIGKNLIAVSADNSANDHTYPQFADFTFFGGIYRDIHLITVPDEHFDLDDFGSPGLVVTSDVDTGNGRAIVTVKGKASQIEGLSFTFKISDGSGNTVTEQHSDQPIARFIIDNPRLWDGVKDPYLYTAEISMIRDSKVLDKVSTRFGIRTFSVDPEKGFFLNGRPYPLRGVCRHQDRENMGWAITSGEHREDMELIAEMGSNTVRLAHYQHAGEFYDLCDEYGMVVWAEIPFISRFMESPLARENTILQMTELVKQNINHPSICFWGIANEITMSGEDNEDLLDNLKALNVLCHELDPSRLTTIANLSMVAMDSEHNHITDVLSYNLYFGWYVGEVSQAGEWLDKFHSLNPDRPLGLSEYGAEGNIRLHTDEPRVRDYSEEYHAYYHERMLETIMSRPYLWATHVWNMFEFASDMRNEGGVAGRNNKGLVTFDRKVKKDAFYIYKAAWTSDPFVHICGRRYAERCGETTKVKVYATGVDSVGLFSNGAEAGRISAGDSSTLSKHVFEFSGVPLKAGENSITAVGYLNGNPVCKEEISLTRVEKPNESYRLPEEPKRSFAGNINVINWFEKEYGGKGEPEIIEGRFSVKDKLGDILKNERASEAFRDFMSEITGNSDAFPPKNIGIMGMIEGLPVERIFQLGGISLPKAALYALNDRLNKITKS